jgi:ubiquinone/menaquinone biosynthesis C-methylase UbiE
MSNSSFDSDNYKAGQRQQWDNVAAGWRKWWETLERISQRVTDRLIHLADIQAGQRVLDFATGIGEPALTIAQRVGEGGMVVATDQSSQMLSIARSRASTLGLDNVVFQELDAEEMDFPDDHFDAIVCRWGLMFLPNLEIVLRSIHRMLVPDGKFATAVWDVPEKIPFFTLAVQTLQQMFQVPPPPPGTPTMSGLAEGVIEDKMARVGFTDIRTEEVTLDFEFSSAGEYVQLMKDVAAPMRAMLAERSPEQQAEFWQTLEQTAAQKYSTPSGGVRLPSRSLCVVGGR